MKVCVLSIYFITILCYIVKAQQNNVFVATREWQVVRKGQKVPKGLHIRINFETGLTEAKLLDEDEKDQALSYNPKDNVVTEDPVIYSKDVEEALKKIRNDEPISVEDGREKFKSYEEIKKDLDEINLTPKSDVELIKELIYKHEEIMSSDNHLDEEIVNIIEDLEYLVHQYDNANEFVRLNGFKQIVYKHLNSTSISLKSEALKLLGSSMQNNPKVQIHAVETGSIDILLRLFSLDENYLVKNRVVYAVGTLLRRFPLAQIKFLENAGLSVFLKQFESNNIKIQIKIITLLNDLLLEHTSALHDINNEQFHEKLNQYKQVDLKQKLIQNNFCTCIYDLLINVIYLDKNDYDSIEKIFHIMDSLIDQCKSSYDERLANAVNIIKNDLKALLTKDEDDSYYIQLYDLSCDIFENLNMYKKKEEL